MIDESAAFVPLWMILSAACGFLIGDLCGDLHRHRKCLEQANEDLRARLNQTTPNQPGLERELKRLRGTLNDLHKQVTTVTKGLPNTLHKPSRINGRISPIRPCQKLYLRKQHNKKIIENLSGAAIALLFR